MRVFWQQHNEHRIVFPEIVIASDLLWFRGRLLLPTILSFASFFGIWLAIAWSLNKDRTVNALPRYAAIFLSAVLIAWTGCAYPLSSPFLLQWTLNQFAAIFALVSLAQLFTYQRTIWLLLLLTCGIVANYSSGNGLLIWPLLLGLAAALRIKARALSAIAATGALSTALYFVAYKQISTVNWRALVTHPVYAARFIASYLSMPFAMLRAEQEFGVRLGLISLAVLAIFFFTAWRFRLLPTPTAIVLFGYAAFLLATGVMIAAGRMIPGNPDLESVRAVRYLTLPLTYWGVLAAIAIWVLARVPRLGAALATSFALALSLLLFRMFHKPAFANFSHAIAQSYATQQWAALAVASGVLDPETELIIHPDVQFVPHIVKLMQSEKLGLFSSPEPSWIGRQSQAVFPAPAESTALGGISASRKLSTAITLAGWTNVKSTVLHPLHLVFIDENNRIVGLGERLPAGLPDCFANLKISPAQQWSGFVNLTYGSQTVSPYVVTENGKSLSPLPAHLSLASLITYRS